MNNIENFFTLIIGLMILFCIGSGWILYRDLIIKKHETQEKINNIGAFQSDHIPLSQKFTGHINRSYEKLKRYHIQQPNQIPFEIYTSKTIEQLKAIYYQSEIKRTK